MRGRFAGLCLLFVAESLSAQAQSATDLNGFSACGDCTLDRVLEARLGDMDGPGLVWGQLPSPVYDPSTDRYAVFSRGGDYVSVFGGNGSFLRSIGRPGQGPGELRYVGRVDVSRASVLVLNFGNQRWSRFTWAGEVIDEVRMGNQPGETWWFHSDSILIGAMGKRPASAGYPLHLVDLSTGQEIRHFGSGGGADTAVEWEPLMARDPGGDGVWLAWAREFRFEKWSLDGRLLRTVHGAPDWYPPITGQTLRSPEPDVYVRDFRVDGRGWLVVLSHTADEEWREAVTDQGYVTDAERYSASRIDVWDLEEGEYLGTDFIPEWEASLFLKGDRVLVNVPEIDPVEGSLTLGLYGLEVRRDL